MKKKYFILFGDRDQNPARLEYFDSEKKWRNGQAPKRYISLQYSWKANYQYISILKQIYPDKVLFQH